jgi:hypothetical protein
MRLVPALVLAGLAGLPLAGAAIKPTTDAAAKVVPVRMKGGEVELRARVVELDRSHRSMTLRAGKSSSVTLDVPADVKGFDKVLVGDDVLVHYLTAILTQLKPTARSAATTPVTSAGGGAPAAAPRTVEMLATLQSLDGKSGTATLRGARRNITVAVPQSIDITRLKAGDEVRASIVEAVVISVEPVPAGK